MDDEQDGDDPTTLIERALAGDRRAGRRLGARLLPVIRARAARVLTRRYGRCAPDRLDDMTQTVWLALIDNGGRRLRAWRSDGGATLEGFVGQAAQRIVLNAIAKSDARKRGGGQAPRSLDDAPIRHADADPEAEAAFRRRLVALCPCLQERLKPLELTIAAMLHLDGVPPADVARTLGVKRNVVDKANRNLKLAMRACLDQEASG